MLSLYRSSVRLACLPASSSAHYATQQPSASTNTKINFKPLDIGNRKEKVLSARKINRIPTGPPRRESQQPDQDWSDVWPVAKTFHPAAVPLPVRQGFVEKPHMRAPAGPEANAELMKVVNFLHLTPPAIAKQCAAIKKFCSAWPANLTDERLERDRPLEVVSQDFVHAAPTIRHPDARVVKLRLRLSHLNLDYHARDKFLRLIGADRYDIATDVVTLVADRCPYRRQNFDYALYLLTVLYFESCKTEEWEALRSVADMEKFVFEGSPSQEAVKRLEVEDAGVVGKYADAVTKLHNDGEDEATVSAYREAVLELLNLPRSSEDAVDAE